MENLGYTILVTFLWLIILPMLGLALAWIPMLGWNHSVAEMFPMLPKMTYWQAFWFVQFSGWVIHRPSVSTK